MRSPWAADGYFDPEQPANRSQEFGAMELFAIDTRGRRWLRTGDIATIDRHGYVRIVDRAKDLIKSGGEWISSQALEASLVQHPDVNEAAVIGRPDARWQERPIAFVTLKAGCASRDKVEITTELLTYSPAALPNGNAPTRSSLLRHCHAATLERSTRSG